ncbi:hypothetical protein E4U15_003714 [Claviceps sp. LM218 group G6]|nr:hypothetical protein E4U15_003714 [Claviceps sp. LM218 group G6]KAG6096483.1 hypothetical protein E4U14_007943 [Claviceps sp. LM454 group G7]
MDNTSNMKASRYEEIIAFKPFKFVVGKGEKEIYMHSELVARWSTVLDKMMNSPFMEGQQGYAVLADEDVRTVAAFAEFVYTGDYQYHRPSVKPPLDSKTEPDSGSESDNGIECNYASEYGNNDQELGRPRNDHWSAFATSREYGFKTSSPESFNFPCGDCKSYLEASSDSCGCCGYKLIAPAAPVLNTGGLKTEYSEFFIAHAKVFVFADCYGIDALMDLSMRKLHQALCGFRLSKARVGDVLALVRFCYERPGPEKLKRLVASYSAAIMDPGVSSLMPDCFQQLLKERGDFAADMAWFLASRAAGSTKC